MGEEWQVVEDPVQHIRDTDGLLNEKAAGTDRTEKTVQKDNKVLSKERKTEVELATLPKNGLYEWSINSDEDSKKSKSGNK